MSGNEYLTMKESSMRKNRGLLLLMATSLACPLLVLTGCSSSDEARRPELVWPAPPEQPRIRLVDELRDGRRYAGSTFDRFIKSLIGETDVTLALKRPLDVAVDDSGNVYAADLALGTIVVFDNVQQRMRTVGQSGSFGLQKPTGITIAESLIVVADVALRQVVVFGTNGQFVRVIGGKDAFVNPTDVGYHKTSGRLFITDSKQHKVFVYGIDGSFVASFGDLGSDPGYLYNPSHVWVQKDKVYVNDALNFRVQIFDVEGNHLGGFGSIGSGFGQFGRPKGVAVTREGFVIVADAAFNNFQVMDEEGAAYMFVGVGGSGPGQFLLPAGVFIDGHDRIYVADQLNARIQVFEFLGEDVPHE